MVSFDEIWGVCRVGMIVLVVVFDLGFFLFFFFFSSLFLLWGIHTIIHCVQVHCVDMSCTNCMQCDVGLELLSNDETSI